MKTIDCTPTWLSLVGPMLDVIANPDASFESRKICREELERMARIADTYVELSKSKPQ